MLLVWSTKVGARERRARFHDQNLVGQGWSPTIILWLLLHVTYSSAQHSRLVNPFAVAAIAAAMINIIDYSEVFHAALQTYFTNADGDCIALIQKIVERSVCLALCAMFRNCSVTST